MTRTILDNTDKIYKLEIHNLQVELKQLKAQYEYSVKNILQLRENNSKLIAKLIDLENSKNTKLLSKCHLKNLD
jgi:hypothetical protein